MDKVVICVENTFKDTGTFKYLHNFQVGQIYECSISLGDNTVWFSSNDYIWVNENLEYYTSKNKIKFEKYNYRKEKLERCLKLFV